MTQSTRGSETLKAQRVLRFTVTRPSGELIFVRTDRHLVPITTDEAKLKAAVAWHLAEANADSGYTFNVDSMDGAYPTICLEWK